MKEHERQVLKYKDWIGGAADPIVRGKEETRRQAHIQKIAARFNPFECISYLTELALKTEPEFDDDEEGIDDPEDDDTDDEDVNYFMPPGVGAVEVVLGEDRMDEDNA